MPVIDVQLFNEYKVMLAVVLMSNVFTKAEVFKTAVLLPINKFLPKPIPSLLLLFKVKFSKKDKAFPLVVKLIHLISPKELL